MAIAAPNGGIAEIPKTIVERDARVIVMSTNLVRLILCFKIRDNFNWRWISNDIISRI